MIINPQKYRRMLGERMCSIALFLLTVLSCTVGCGNFLAPRPAPLFHASLSIDGEAVEAAVIDTGGAFELMLREDYGLQLVDTADVVALTGVELVNLTEAFDYEVGGWASRADTALVGVSVCDCNGVGFFFLRKSGAVLELDYSTLKATFLTSLPRTGITIPFATPPEALTDFDSAFIEVVLESGGESRTVLALLDTGTNATIMHRKLAREFLLLRPDRSEVLITHAQLGTVSVNVALFDTPGLPDLILGTDMMRAWGDRWYFSYTPRSGSITVVPATAESPPSVVSLDQILSSR